MVYWKAFFVVFVVLALSAACAAILGWGDLTTRLLETAGFSFMAWVTRRKIMRFRKDN
jgi:hypothetical protein